MTSLEISQHLLPFLLIVSFAGIVHGFTGFGFGLASMSIFALANLPLERASSLLTVVSIPMLAIFALSELRSGRPNLVPTLLVLVGIVLGVPIGYSVILHYGGSVLFSIGFGLFVVSVAIWRLTRSNIAAPIAVGWGPLFGFLGGFIGGAVVSGGPAVVIYLYANSDDPRDEKAALQIIFLAASLVRLLAVGNGSAGLSWELVGLGVLISPLPLALILFASRFSRRITVERFRQVVHLFLLLVGLSILAKVSVGFA